MAKQSVEQLNAHRDLAQGFFDVGIIPRNDLLYAEVELANGQQLLLRAENSLDMAKAKFNTILRRVIDSPVEIDDILKLQPWKRPSMPVLPPLWRTGRRSGLICSEWSRRRATSNSRRANTIRMSALSVITPGTETRRASLEALTNLRKTGTVLAIANWNFWEWGKTKHRVDAGISRENQAADVLTNIRDQITLEVKNAFLLLHETEKQVQVMEKAIEQAEENFRINTERYREQVGTTTDVIDAQTLLTKAKADHFNALGDLNINQARMERAMGVRRVDNP